MKGDDDILRRERMPIRLLLGERPAAAGADDGATGLHVEGRAASSRLGVMMGRARAAGAEYAFFKTK